MRECCECGAEIKKGYKCDAHKRTAQAKVRHCRDCTKVVTRYQRCPKHRAERARKLKLKRRDRAKKAHQTVAAA